MLTTANHFHDTAQEQQEVGTKTTACTSDINPPFASGLCFYKMVWIFALCSLLGVVIETVFCFIFKGYFESRQGMLYGPFNQVYGFGAVLLALLLMRVSEKGAGAIFAVSAIAGGVFEIVCSFVQEQALGTVSWDYKWMLFSIAGGRTNLLYIVFWGFLGIGYIRYVYPALSGLVERLRVRRGKVITWGIVVFMTVNLCLSAAVVFRWTERQAGAPADNNVERFIDTHYPDEMLNIIYPSMVTAK